MALTKISTDGVKDDAITKAKIPADQIEASELANNAVDTNAIQDEAVTLAKLEHGNANNNGKFLRANNGADPSFEDVPAGGISDVVSDTTPQLGGDLQSNGNDIDFADSDKAIFGGGADLKIFHDGNSNYLDCVNDKPLRVVNDTQGLNELMILATPGAGVELYYDNAKKLETLGNGVRVQGGILFGSDTAEANKLDDYEEGTIDNINVLNGYGYLGSGSDANAAPTMTYNGGKYVKIGSMVYVHMRIKIGSYSSSNGNGIIFGIMPFYADRGGTESLLESHLGCWMNSCSSGGENVYADTYGSSKYYYGIRKRTNTGHSDFSGSNGGSGFDCAINGWYRIE
jgi:hypothetical protein|tara:strand:- start:59 stop:1084 length:1026 start_codon:yes stop_codon:yes gene_type:complete